MNIVDQYRLSQLRRDVAIQRFICGEVDVAKLAADLGRLGYSRSEIESEIRDAVEDGGAASESLSTGVGVPPQQFDCGREPARRAMTIVPTVTQLPGDNSNSGQAGVANHCSDAGTRRETDAPFSGDPSDRSNHNRFVAAGDGGRRSAASQNLVAAIATNPADTRRISHGIA